MDFEWDDRKAARNLRKHKVSFETVRVFEFETAMIHAVDFEEGEERVRMVGFIGPRLHVLVYTERGETIRVISLRRAENHEKRWYHEESA